MKIDPEGKAEIETLLLTLHPPGHLETAFVHESGETATVQIADQSFRYQLLPPAKKILCGEIALYDDLSELFKLIQ